METSSLYRLMTWFSPSYPIGSFGYSHGIEYAVHCRLIRNANSLKEWVEAILEFGTGRIDAILFKVTHELCQDLNMMESTQFDELIDLSNALKSSPELWGESHKQGEAALKILLTTYPSPHLLLFHKTLEKKKKYPVLPVIFGIVCAEHRIPLVPALLAFLYAFASNLVLAGIKLIPLGQTEGQKILVDLEHILQKTITRAVQSNIEDVGSATPMVDWTSIKHETQYTRLFQS